ncbi:unnamed protein product [Owenia fusiformis]|uniref:Uncharacterized protein n=1 Tax=Owenia fusiformis TaxID=6347 RepID=A0A8J1UTW3_OWEFU|nr:unnamed protein product [Owenia fusiformis]
MSGRLQMALSSNMAGESRNLGNGHNTNAASPLKIFGHAKSKIRQVFKNIDEYVTESDRFLSGVPAEERIVDAMQIENVKAYRGKIRGIIDVLNRDHMKVAFFGRTSNGKSTVINAMLRDKILPSGIGHTTICFVCVEGTDEPEGYLLQEGSDDRKQIGDVQKLGSALSSTKASEDSMIRINWPKDKCNLLKDDVILVDSPGIDVHPNTDVWIDKFCMDADVFVLVSNAESTLMQTEKNFFHKVSERLSKPNIFILNNRWDASASEPEYAEQVKRQHLERDIDFLANELKVCSKTEAEDRVFFVSAKEALISRSPHTSTPTSVLAEGYQARLFEFADFERKFEECISKSAVKTKFEQHTVRGKSISSELMAVLDNVFERAIHMKAEKYSTRKEHADKLDYVDRQLDMMTKDIKSKIYEMTEEVERTVSSALNEEIRRLSLLVDEFDRPFLPDRVNMDNYKKGLHAYVEKSLGRNLQSRCSKALTITVEEESRQMTEKMVALLPEEQKQNTLNFLPRRDFEIAYKLDCRNLCADFHEDLEFRFSYGITALVNRFMGPKQASMILGRGFVQNIPRSMPMTPQTPTNEAHRTMGSDDNEVLLALLATFSSLYSRTTVGALAVTGLVAKAAGWRILALSGAIYGLLYLYERLLWTNKAKERKFKHQYVKYASSKLKLIVDLTGANCSHQVQQELSTTFTQLCQQVDLSKADLQEEIKKLNKEIGKLEEIGAQSKSLRNKASYIDSELNSFILTYLKQKD